LAFSHCGGTKKNEKLQICMDFWKLNIATKKNPYPLPFMKEVLDMVVGHEVYLIFDDFLGYHQIMITLEDMYCLHYILGNICLDNHAFWIEKCSTNLLVNNAYCILWIPQGVHEIAFKWFECIQWPQNEPYQTLVVFWQMPRIQY
jgi:hypothetical protein